MRYLIYWVNDNYPFSIVTTDYDTESNEVEMLFDATEIGADTIKAEMYSLRKLIKYLTLKSKPTDKIISKLVSLETEYPEKII